MDINLIVFFCVGGPLLLAFMMLVYSDWPKVFEWLGGLWHLKK